MNEEEKEQQPDKDFSHQRALREARNTAPEKKGLEAKIANELMELIENGHKTTAFILAFLLATLSDFADFFGVPSIPLIGDILDLATGGILTLFFWNIGGFVKIKVKIFTLGASLFELLPFFFNDIVPTYILGVILSWHIVSKEARNAEEHMDAVQEKGGEIAHEELEYNE